MSTTELNLLNGISPYEILQTVKRHRLMIENPKATWRTLKMSENARNTVNPIRRIADQMNIKPNPKKSMIKLHLGDPTLTGTLQPSDVALTAIREAVESHKNDGYGPAIGTEEARRAVAEFSTHPEAPVTSDDVILTSGCSHALQIAIEGLCDAGDNILVPHPGFPLYGTLCRPCGVEDRGYTIDMLNGEIELEKLEKLIDSRTKAIIVNNPSNPTGIVFSKKHLEDILAMAERHRLVIIADEIYGDMVYNGAIFHPLSTLSPKVPILTADGIAKRFLVPGWRLGWLLIHDRFGVLTEVKKGMHQLAQKIVGPCSLIQGALPKILKETPESFFEHTKRVLSRNADIAYENLVNVPGLTPVRPTGAMYMMVGVDRELLGEETKFVQGLIAEESVFCLPGSAFQAPDWFRIVLTYPDEVTLEACSRIAQYCERHINRPEELPSAPLTPTSVEELESEEDTAEEEYLSSDSNSDSLEDELLDDEDRWMFPNYKPIRT